MFGQFRVDEKDWYSDVMHDAIYDAIYDAMHDVMYDVNVNGNENGNGSAGCEYYPRCIIVYPLSRRR